MKAKRSAKKCQNCGSSGFILLIIVQLSFVIAVIFFANGNAQPLANMLVIVLRFLVRNVGQSATGIHSTENSGSVTNVQAKSEYTTTRAIRTELKVRYSPL